MEKIKKLFGVIIICNSKSPKDSALKCFIFFLISQPLIYLLQVPFSWQGWHLFSYYKYWFIWTLLTIPMGYIGYYIKKDNILSVIILLPMLILLSLTGIGFFSTEQGTAEITEKDGKHVLRLTGIKNAIYKFGISSEDDGQLRFEYHFDDNGKLVLEKDDESN